MVDQTKLELVETAPVRYHQPDLCKVQGGEVYEYLFKCPGFRPENVLVCNVCHRQVEPEATLTREQLLEIERLICTKLLDTARRAGPGAPFWQTYEDALEQTRKTITAPVAVTTEAAG